MKLQLCIAAFLCLSGVLLLLLGFWVPPVGIIDSSVLVAFGEMSTFAGALLGLITGTGMMPVNITRNEESACIQQPFGCRHFKVRHN